MLATLIQKYDKNHFIFDPVQEQETGATFYDCITVKPVLNKHLWESQIWLFKTGACLIQGDFHFSAFNRIWNSGL